MIPSSKCIANVAWLLALTIPLFSCQEYGMPSRPSLPQKVAIEYIPLKVGNKWTYSFQNYYSSPGSQDVYNYRGTSNWEIISHSRMEQADFYLLQETIDGVSMHTFDWGYARGGDTATIVGAKFQFAIIDSSDHSLRLQFQPNGSQADSPNAYLARAAQSLHLASLMESASPRDTLVLGQDWDYSVTLVKSVGIIKYQYHISGNSHTTNQAALISFQLK